MQNQIKITKILMARYLHAWTMPVKQDSIVVSLLNKIKTFSTGGSRVITHHSTNPARSDLASQFGMGWGACQLGMAECDSHNRPPAISTTTPTLISTPTPSNVLLGHSKHTLIANIYLTSHYNRPRPAHYCPTPPKSQSRGKDHSISYRTTTLCGLGLRPSHSTPHFQSIYPIPGPLLPITTKLYPNPYSSQKNAIYFRAVSLLPPLQPSHYPLKIR